MGKSGPASLLTRRLHALTSHGLYEIDVEAWKVLRRAKQRIPKYPFRLVASPGADLLAIGRTMTDSSESCSRPATRSWQRREWALRALSLISRKAHGVLLREWRRAEPRR